MHLTVIYWSPPDSRPQGRSWVYQDGKDPLLKGIEYKLEESYSYVQTLSWSGDFCTVTRWMFTNQPKEPMNSVELSLRSLRLAFSVEQITELKLEISFPWDTTPWDTTPKLYLWG